MEKKIYESPKTVTVKLVNEVLLDVVSPGEPDQQAGSRGRTSSYWSEED